MRFLRYAAFLLVALAATGAFASGPNGGNRAPSAPQGRLFQDAHGNFQFSIAPQVANPRVFSVPVAQDFDRRQQLLDKAIGDGVRQSIENDNVCYFIRSYIMKREGEHGAIHLDRVETCTPMSRVHTKRTVRIIPATAP